jgi:thiol peroxidase
MVCMLQMLHFGIPEFTQYDTMLKSIRNKRRSIMAQITLKGQPIHTSGALPAIGSKAPEFTLTGADLKDVRLSDFAGKKVILNISPSIDTSICAVSVRTFNQRIAEFSNATVVYISRDLPFAQARFCGAEGIENVVTASEMKNTNFGKDYGVTITDGPMEGLLARAVIVIDENQRVIYGELVPEIAQDPDFEVALKALSEPPAAVDKAPQASAGADLDACQTSFTAEHSRADNLDDACNDGRSGGR